MKTPEIISLRWPFGSATGTIRQFIRAAELNAYVNSVSASLLLPMEGSPELGPLRLYVRQTIQGAPAYTVYAEPTFGDLVESSEAKSIIDLLRAIPAKLSNLKPLAMTLRVRSFPDGAMVRLVSEEGSRHRDATTSEDLPNVFRGEYKYEVRRRGYEPAVGYMNLVDDDREFFSCYLLPTIGPRDEGEVCRRRPPWWDKNGKQ